jgi:hypothetical protein
LKVPLSGHPNNMAVGKDGRRVYVGIAQAPGGGRDRRGFDAACEDVVLTEGPIHNAYVTPDRRLSSRDRSPVPPST